jgi:hypothetical protein
MFPVRYELNFYVLFRRYSTFEWLTVPEMFANCYVIIRKFLYCIFNVKWEQLPQVSLNKQGFISALFTQRTCMTHPQNIFRQRRNVSAMSVVAVGRFVAEVTTELSSLWRC